MNLANLVHHHRHNPNKPACPPPHQRILACRTRAAQVYDREMASALTASPYTSQPSVYAQSHQHRSSSPAEDLTSKCTLPSIQSLIGMTDTSASKAEQQRKLLHHPKPHLNSSEAQQAQTSSSSKDGRLPHQCHRLRIMPRPV